MNGTRSAYQSIMKEYENRRLGNARLLSDHHAEVEAAIPGFSDLEEEITSLYVKRAIERAGGESSASEEDFQASLKELIGRKNLLLASSGFPADFLEPVYTCEKCQDTGFTDGEMCSCFKTRLTEVMYDNSRIRDILERENFSVYTYDYYSDIPEREGQPSPWEAAHSAVKTAFRFIEEFEASKTNLFIYGDTGTGKTFLANCIAAELICRGFFTVYVSAVKFFKIMADAAFSGEDAKYIYDCDLLILDDLGTEMTNSFTQTQLFDCINERYLDGKHTIISANLSLEQLRENYTERIFSRIASNYKIIKLTGDDIRRKKKLEG